MVRQWQTFFYDQRYTATNLSDPADFVLMAQGMGAKACRVTTLDEFKTVFQEVLQERTEPVVIVCEISKDDKVFPMIAP